MSMSVYFRKPVILTLFLPVLATFVFAQRPDFPEPREETLLNDLKVLIWNQPDTDKVTVKMRIHTGAAFDPKDKMGTVALLSDILFPSEEIRKLFEEDLEGSLQIVTGYDYIQINAIAKADEFLTVLQTLAPAITNPTIDKETVGKVKAKRIERIKKLESNPSYVAERRVAKKLLGDFPYGRPYEGTVESMSKIDFADVIFAKQKFLTSDNATLAIIGNVRSNFAYRAARRLFGGWNKRTEKIPALFRLPDAPDLTPETINVIGDKSVEAHYAVNGFARNYENFFASKILERILQNRLRKISQKDEDILNTEVKHDSHLLRGLFFYKQRVLSSDLTERPEGMIKTILEKPISQMEFDTAKSETLSKVSKTDYTELWLDIDTYKLKSVRDEMKKITEIKIDTVRTMAGELRKEPFTQAIVLFKKEGTSLKQDPDPKDPEK